MILVAPSEPVALKEIGKSSTIPEMYGADLLIPGNGILVGIQRKQFPGDFIASMSDGRLQTSLLKLSQVDVPILVLEGRPSWSFNGFLVGFNYGRGGEFARSTLRSLLFSAQSELGITHHWTDSMNDTIDFTRDLARWAEKDKHDSLFKRPGIPKNEATRRISDRDRAAWILQGLDNIGYTTACSIYDYFEGLPLRWTVTKKELQEVPGVGKGRAVKLTTLIGEKQ